MKKVIQIIIGIMLAGQVFAVQYYVSKNGNDSNNGLSWASALATPQTAINKAGAGDQVWIASGSYGGISMKSGVSVYGGFAGNETSLASRDIVKNKATIAGVSDYDLSSVAKLDGVTITDKNGTGVSSGSDTMEYHNCNITGNTDGGVYVSGNAKFYKCSIVNNTAEYNGGGISCYGGSPYFENCTIANNEAGAAGGGISTTFDDSARFVFCTIANNTAENPRSTAIVIAYGMGDVGTGHTKFENCIITGTSYVVGGSKITASNCVIPTAPANKHGDKFTYTKTNVITTAPKLGELGNYGGAVPTIPVLAGSSAIGKGKDMGITTDARGVARSAAPTIGAYEYTVNEKTNIAVQPEDVGVEEGNNAIFTVKASGKAPLKYQWQILEYGGDNWSNIVNQTKNTLSLAKVGKALSGNQYRCVVSNSGGTVYSDAAELTVSAKISFDKKKDYTYTTVKNASPHIYVMGISDAEACYQWQRLDGKNWVDLQDEYAAGDLYTYEEDGYKFYTSYNVDTATFTGNSAKFRCVVWNKSTPGQKSVSSIYTVSISSKSIVFEDPKDLKTGVSGSTYHLGFYGEMESTSQYEIQRLDGKNWVVVDSGTCEDSWSNHYFYASYEGDSSSINKNAQFRCVAWKAPSGEKVISKAITIVICKPMEMVVNTKKHIPEAFDGERATLSVNVTGGYGKVEYDWYCDGIFIEGANSATYTTEILSDANGDFDKTYTVYAWSDSDDYLHRDFHITKLSPAEVSSISPSQVVGEGDNAEITVFTTPESGSKLTYAWEVCTDGKTWKIAGKTNPLVLKNVSTKLNGAQYRCKVSNAGNKNNPSISGVSTLTVIPAAVLSSANLAVKTLSGEVVKLSVNTKQGHNVLYTWSLINPKTKKPILTWTTTTSETYLPVEYNTSEYSGHTITCTAQSRDDNGNLLGKVSSKSGKITSMEPASVAALRITQLGEEFSVYLPDDYCEFDAYLDFELILQAKASGYSVKYQWEVSYDGEYWSNVPKATSATYKPSMKIEDWIGFESFKPKYFRCKVYNSYGNASNAVYTPVAAVCASVLPISNNAIVGKSLYDYKGFRIIFKNNKDAMVFADPNLAFSNSTYTLKVRNKDEADITLTAKVTDASTNATKTRKYSGILSYDGDCYILKNLYESSQKLDNMTLYSEEADDNPPDSLPLNTVIRDKNGGSEIIRFTSKKDCICYGSFNGTYKYKKITNNLWELSISIPKYSKGISNVKLNTLLFLKESLYYPYCGSAISVITSKYAGKTYTTSSSVDVYWENFE